jgi:hypothetical protein
MTGGECASPAGQKSLQGAEYGVETQTGAETFGSSRSKAQSNWSGGWFGVSRGLMVSVGGQWFGVEANV